MTDLERALRMAAGWDVSEPAARATGLFPDAAREAGLLDIAYAVEETPIGRLLIAATRRGLVRIGFLVGQRVVDDLLDELATLVSPRLLEYPADLDEARRQLDEYFAGARETFDLPLDWRLVRGFNRLVLRETARIPYGGTTSYAEVAARAGSPRAARAAGNALNRNPLPIVVPCHRVLHKGGGLGGYGGGLEVKQFLLRLEGAIL